MSKPVGIVILGVVAVVMAIIAFMKYWVMKAAQGDPNWMLP